MTAQAMKKRQPTISERIGQIQEQITALQQDMLSARQVQTTYQDRIDSAERVLSRALAKARAYPGKVTELELSDAGQSGTVSWQSMTRHRQTANLFRILSNCYRRTSASCRMSGSQSR